MKTAVVIGATGLVGNHLVHLLLGDDRFSKVIVFARRSLGLENVKLEEHIINFDQPSTWQHWVKGDVIFSALGTTIKQAGSQQAQYTIDYHYQHEFAKAAAANGVPIYVLVSSSGANSDSKIFYTRMKGELEQVVQSLPFRSIYLIQPSLLVGTRREERVGEKVGFTLLNAFNAIGLFKKSRPIPGKVVAQAMLKASIEAADGIHTYTLDKVFALAES